MSFDEKKDHQQENGPVAAPKKSEPVAKPATNEPKKKQAQEPCDVMTYERAPRFSDQNRAARKEVSEKTAVILKMIKLKQKREEAKLVRDKGRREIRDATMSNIIQGDYSTRGLDYCYFCGEKFTVGEKIPRILIHCGHTFCTECLTYLHHNFRIRCPICAKLVKQIETIDKLPLNFNILYEIVERDPILRDINFEDEECVDCLFCERHD